MCSRTGWRENLVDDIFQKVHTPLLNGVYAKKSLRRRTTDSNICGGCCMW